VKRFIDITAAYYAEPEPDWFMFAWIDTITDRFEEHSGCQMWYSWEEFVADYEGSQISRYKALFPKEKL